MLLAVSLLAGCQNLTHSDNEDYRNSAFQPKLNYSNLTSRAYTYQPGMQARAAVPASGYGDLWQRLCAGYQMRTSDHGNARVRKQQEWFTNNPQYVQNAALRGSLYLHYVVERLEERNMPSELALLPMVESAYNPVALSPASAAGLWQFMPATGRNFNLRQTRFYDGRRDITDSTTAALDYLSYLHQMFNGDWLLALAAYNSGEGTVTRAIARNARLGLPTDYWSLPLPQETRDYVPRLLALADVIETPQSYLVKLTPIANQAYFVPLNFGDQPLDLAQIAVLGEIDPTEFTLLNPAFLGRRTQGGEPQHLLIPLAKASLLTARLASLNNDQRMTMQMPTTITEQRSTPAASRWATLSAGATTPPTSSSRPAGAIPVALKATYSSSPPLATISRKIRVDNTPTSKPSKTDKFLTEIFGQQGFQGF
ncbi:lytic transglycosylase [Pseudomonas caspiana]|nr:transglycosylase SLT domain-containing protein [Pseudomonas caspiana]TPG87833.1 lytic transglycosylase [Pseudomonas caspiana]